jgi:hypothetical protein
MLTNAILGLTTEVLIVYAFLEEVRESPIREDPTVGAIRLLFPIF